MPTIRIPLVGSLTNRGLLPSVSSGAFATDQYFDNCFPEITVNQYSKQSAAIMSKRPGIDVLASTVSSQALGNLIGSYGATIWTGRSTSTAPIVASYKNISVISTMFFSGTSKVGADVPSTQGCAYLDETLISGVPHLTATLLDGVPLPAIYFYADGGTWTAVTSAVLTTSSTPLCPDHCHMDGYMFVMRKDGQIFNTDLNTVSSVTATNFIATNSFADKGIGVARYKNTIVGFGDYSIEFFFNAGNATGSVLSRIANATLRIGCLRRNDLLGRVFMPVGDTIYWMGLNPETGHAGIYRLKGYGAEKISTPTVDKFLGGPVSTYYIIGVFSMMGMSHLMLGVANATTYLCYCIDSNFWWRINIGNAMQLSIVLGGASNSPERSILVSPDTAKLYQFSVSTTPLWRDDTSTYSLTIQTANMDLDTNKQKYWRKLHSVYDRQASTSPITVSASDNDGASYSAIGSIDTVSTNTQSWITRLGASRRRSWKFNHSSNTACRIQAIEIDYDVGKS